MIKIDNVNAKEAEKYHLRYCKPFILERVDFLLSLFNEDNKNLSDAKPDLHHETIDSILKTLNSNYENAKNNGLAEIQLYPKKDKCISLLKLIKRDIDKLLVGKEKTLYNFHSKYDKEYKCFENLIKKIFNYERLIGDGFKISNDDFVWNSYELTRILNTNVCPYCNKNWINTVVGKKGKITNPQLDHFLCKKNYPFLRLSLYNLVPSCETCNSRIKGEKDFKENFINPYENEFGKDGKVFALPSDTDACFGSGKNYKINIDTSQKSALKSQIEESYKFFKIKEVYEAHADIVAEIYFKFQKYNENNIESLKGLGIFQNMPEAEIYNMIYSNYYSEKDFSKRPLSKLTKDTYDKLREIKDLSI